jgi:hypothetical protein
MATETEEAETRYFLDQDSSCHWYLVRADKRTEWEAWNELNEEDERAWEPPEFAKRLSGGPMGVTFTDPVGVE